MNEPTWTQNHLAGTYTASARCYCGRVTTATVQASDLFRYRQGAFVQDAFPYLSTDEREALFMTGTCASCWDDMFLDE